MSICLFFIAHRRLEKKNSPRIINMNHNVQMLMNYMLYEEVITVIVFFVQNTSSSSPLCSFLQHCHYHYIFNIIAIIHTHFSKNTLSFFVFCISRALTFTVLTFCQVCWRDSSHTSLYQATVQITQISHITLYLCTLISSLKNSIIPYSNASSIIPSGIHFLWNSPETCALLCICSCWSRRIQLFNFV